MPRRRPRGGRGGPRAEGAHGREGGAGWSAQWVHHCDCAAREEARAAVRAGHRTSGRRGPRGKKRLKKRLKKKGARPGTSRTALRNEYSPPEGIFVTKRNIRHQEEYPSPRGMFVTKGISSHHKEVVNTRNREKQGYSSEAGHTGAAAPPRAQVMKRGPLPMPPLLAGAGALSHSLNFSASPSAPPSHSNCSRSRQPSTAIEWLLGAIEWWC
eukprot:TRINITY_DN1438_c0_g1_i1.p1 TRINITY_DN1438_c0_g1~~TRINITY_DN1438_c0_g1_i1.p1  ORF type:complete len:212 (-),score=8.29 TRINITY_DN1438_c0_g1_i1:75-710(-)